jgi:hypothetical protein
MFYATQFELIRFKVPVIQNMKHYHKSARIIHHWIALTNVGGDLGYQISLWIMFSG